MRSQMNAMTRTTTVASPSRIVCSSTCGLIELPFAWRKRLSQPTPDGLAINLVLGAKLLRESSLFRHDLPASDVQHEQRRYDYRAHVRQQRHPGNQHDQHPEVHRISRDAIDAAAHDVRGILWKSWINRRACLAKGEDSGEHDGDARDEKRRGDEHPAWIEQSQTRRGSCNCPHQ